MPVKSVRADSEAHISAVFGSYDTNIKIIEEIFGVTAVSRSGAEGPTIILAGENEDSVAKAAESVSVLCRMSSLQGDITEQTAAYAAQMIRDGREDELGGLDDDCVCITERGKPIRAKTVGQKNYIEAIRKNTVVLGVGPAGTGKTFLAVAMAVTALRSKEVQRIILTRPAVEAGEKLGYLPGDLQMKIEPYLRPLYDALYEMMGVENYKKNVERGVIEIAPLAYMRGRTLNDSFIILDEAQNTTPEQMKMLLTRLGYNSKAVVTGDITQTDLPDGAHSGLAEACEVLGGISGIAVHRFDDKDVVGPGFRIQDSKIIRIRDHDGFKIELVFQSFIELFALFNVCLLLIPVVYYWFDFSRVKEPAAWIQAPLASVRLPGLW